MYLPCPCSFWKYAIVSRPSYHKFPMMHLSLIFMRLVDDPAAAAKASGLLSAGGSILTLFAVPFWGATSDAIGRKPVILIGLLGNAVAYALVGLIPSMSSLIVGVVITRVTVATVTVCKCVLTHLLCCLARSFIFSLLVYHRQRINH